MPPAPIHGVVLCAAFRWIMDKTLQVIREQIASKAKWSKSQLAAVNDPQDQCDEYEHEHFTGMVDAYDIALAVIDEAAAKQASERCLADELNAALNLITIVRNFGPINC
jgi:hypothetical protein